MKSVRKHLESLLARAARRVIPGLPRPAVMRLSRFLGGAAYGVSSHLRQVGYANLDLAFGPSMSRAEKKKILVSSFRNFALVMLDSFWFLRDTAPRLEKWVRFDPGMGVVLRPAAQVCVTAHLGNWEVIGQAVAHRGFPLTSVAAPLANPDVDAVFMETRRQTGQKVLSKHGVVRALLRTLRGNGKIALLLDQNTKPSDGGLFVDFFGLPVPVSSAAALLAQRTGTPIVVGICIPQPDGTYYVPAAMEAPPVGQSLELATQQVTSILEDCVRRYPHCWLWTYKRWKYVAPGMPRERFPFYAKAMSAEDEAIARAPAKPRRS